jgi:hypothetical protein
MQFLTILKLILTILPLLMDAIKLIEQLIPESGKGSAKLGAVKAVIEPSYLASNETLPFESAWPVIEKVISGIVTALNDAGVFKK